jgi:hypothetical protein
MRRRPSNVHPPAELFLFLLVHSYYCTVIRYVRQTSEPHHRRPYDVYVGGICSTTSRQNTHLGRYIMLRRTLPPPPRVSLLLLLLLLFFGSRARLKKKIGKKEERSRKRSKQPPLPNLGKEKATPLCAAAVAEI